MTTRRDNPLSPVPPLAGPGARGPRIRFSGRVEARSLGALEQLVFLNPQQGRVVEGIRRALAHFGPPRIETRDGELRVLFGQSAPQTLFAYDDRSRAGHPVGVVIFTRTAADTMFVVHIAVHPDYSLHGRRAGLGLGVDLIEQVRIIASRIVGVRRVELFYGKDIELNVPPAPQQG